MFDRDAAAAAEGVQQLPTYTTGTLQASLYITAPQIAKQYHCSRAAAYRLLHCVPLSSLVIIDDGVRRLMAAPRRQVEGYYTATHRGCPLMRDATYQRTMAKRRWDKYKQNLKTKAGG